MQNQVFKRKNKDLLMTFTTKLTCIAFILMATPTYGVTAKDAQKELARCSKVIDNLQRLTCFDVLAESSKKIMATLEYTNPQVAKASESVSTVAVTNPEVKYQAPQAVVDFDKKQQQEENFAKAKLSQETVPEVTTISLTIAQLKKMLRGEWKITFTNGQVWQQNGTDRFSLKVDQSVQISKGSLGSYYLKKQEGNKRIQVKRLK
jgi:hypothetical protein